MQYRITLDANKCKSFAFSDGSRFVPNRAIIVNESEVDKFRSAGVFIIQQYTLKGGEELKPKKVLKSRKIERAEKNPEEKGEAVEEKSKAKEKAEEKESSKPKGIITKGDLKPKK